MSQPDLRGKVPHLTSHISNSKYINPAFHSSSTILRQIPVRILITDEYLLDLANSEMAKPTTTADIRAAHGNRQPLLRRKMDTLYFVFFFIHIPVMLCKSVAHLFFSLLLQSSLYLERRGRMDHGGLIAFCRVTSEVTAMERKAKQQ